MRLDHDDQAVFQVVEAVLVAVLVATTLIFFALVSRPPGGSSSEGQDLAILAGDVLDILGSSGKLNALAGDVVNNQPADVRAEITPLLPGGLLYEVRADCNAADTNPPPAVAGPTSDPASPRNAQAAASYADVGGSLCLVELVVWNGF